MRKWLRGLRGAVGMGVTWAVAWFGAGAVLGAATLVTLGGAGALSGALGFLAFNALIAAGGGFVVGAAFSGVLEIAEGRRRFDQMSFPRFASWGAIGGAIVGALQLTINIFPAFGFPMSGFLLVAYGLLGAGCAAGSLALARKADDRELLESGQEAAEIGLTEAEKRQLLRSVSAD